MPETAAIEAVESINPATTSPMVTTPDIVAAPANTGNWWSGLSLDSLYGLVETGGPVVAILLVLSVFATTVILLKIGRFLWAGVGRHRRVRHAERLWQKGHQSEALTLIAKRRNPVARVLAHGMRGLIHHQHDEQKVREDVERVALKELAELRSLMKAIEAVVQVAPLLGLFGTVLGMIDAFRALQSAGAEADPAVLAGGIWVALMTTAVGLAIAIPAALFLYWFEGIVERERVEIEQAMTSLFTGRITDAANATTKPTSPPLDDIRSAVVNGATARTEETPQLTPVSVDG
jgi:biopolymer transport protein ExbB